MSQGQIQVQKTEQSLRQTQTVSQQQMLQACLTELPINQLVERVNTELNDNPALEADDTEAPDTPTDFDETSPVDDDTEDSREREERQSALDDALSGIGRDDEELPVYSPGGNTQDGDREEMVYGDTKSFYDALREEMAEVVMTEREKSIMEYLIGSLDDDGLLRKSADNIADELAIYHHLDATPKEIEAVIDKLQQFDPAGIGAHDLQECLLLQTLRKEPSATRDLMTKVISDYFDEFTKKRWDKIKSSLRLSDLQAETLSKELRKLNPKPGASLCETVGRNMQQITPDFIVDTHDDGSVTFTLNNSNMPELHVSQSFADMMRDYKEGATMSRQMKEALLYTKRKVDAAQSFIEAIKTRRHTLVVTMQAIIHWQHKFFEDGDEASLRPMRLRDIAEKTGLDISTLSRVSNSKYAQTRWGIFPLRHFFSDGFVTESGEELSTRQVKAALKEIVDKEDKSNPLSDEMLSDILAKKGFPIARRTVAKYREQLGIPVARLRR